MISLSIHKAGNLTGVKIHTEAVESYDPTHFVILLDTSDSMNEEGKLDNVKRCINLLMQIINTNDYISLITFASVSTIHLKRVQADTIHRSQIDTTVANIKTDGSTNLSAGLSNLVSVLEEETIKTGVILLTDGHANVGMCEPIGLLNMVTGLRARFPTMSISSIAYGSNHNADLLMKIAKESGSSSYSIINSLEDAATAIGDCLGGFMSIIAQNVELHFPTETRVRTSYPIVEERAKLGDLYSGTDTLILVEFPEALQPYVKLTGILCKTLENVLVEKNTIDEISGRDKNLELTDIRLLVSNIFRLLRIHSDQNMITREVEELEIKLRDEFLSGPVCSMLHSELDSIRNVLNGVNVNHSILQQHETFTSIGRGVTTSIPPHSLRAGGLSRQNTTFMTEDPVAPILSPFQNRMQRQFAHTLRSLSQQAPDSYDP